MNTIGEFLALVCNTENRHAKMLIEYWKEQVSPEEWESCEKLPLSMKTILNMRDQISILFRDRLAGICIDALYDRVQRAHTTFIFEYDEKARQQGFAITEKRACISFTEAFREAGVIRVTGDGVSLTPKGVQIAQSVQREIDENRE